MMWTHFKDFSENDRKSFLKTVFLSNRAHKRWKYFGMG